MLDGIGDCTLFAGLCSQFGSTPGSRPASRYPADGHGQKCWFANCIPYWLRERPSLSYTFPDTSWLDYCNALYVRLPLKTS